MLKEKIKNRLKAPASFLIFGSFLILGTTFPSIAEQPISITPALDETCIYNISGSALTNPTLYIFTNSVFSYYGYPTNIVNVIKNWPQNAQGQGYNSCPTNELGAEARGIYTNLIAAPQPGLDVSFTITARQFEIHAWDESDDNCDIYDEDDGSLTTFNCGANGDPQWFLVQYATNKTRHLRLYFQCNTAETVPGTIFNGINVGQGDSISADTGSMPGMMVTGDSYCQGWNPITGGWFYDSYATLAGFLTNGGSFHAMADGIGGSGFLANGEGTNYAARFFTDVVPYANLFKFYVIQASINDGGLTNPATGQLYTAGQYFAAVTNMIGLAKTYLPNKEIAVLGIPYNDGPNAQYNPGLNTNAMAAARAMNVPYFDAIDQNQGAGIIPAQDVGWDNVHLSQAGYQLVANFLNSQMSQAFSDYPANQSTTVVQTNQPNGSMTLNATDYGAVGNAVQFFVNTVSNSTVVSVSGTNVFSSSDVGKVIEVFGAGPWLTYSNWGPVVTQQDIVCLITNVSQGTNLSLSIPCGRTMNAYCVVGNNNASAFQAAINQASAIVSNGQYTNVIINIPAGTYLMMSSNVLNPNYVMNSISDTHPAITISSGGITLMGSSASNTILMGCGAGMEHLVAPGTPITWINPGYAPYVPMRDTLVFCQGPVANNQYPLVFQNITMDGGVQQGQQPYNYWTLIQGNGEGWDTTHHAVADFDDLVTYQMHQMKVFTNCVFQHWRGEILICWTGCMTNAFNDIANCTFYDGNATADNMYYGQHVHGCTFNGLGKVMEYYQADATLPTVFENNLWTNIAPNNNYALTIVGAVTNAVPQAFTIQNNAFHDEAGVNAIQFSPAANVSVISNSFIGGIGGVVFTSAGVQPNNGTAIPVMTNFVIADNNFNCANPLSMDGYSVDGMSISNNTGISVVASAGFKDHITMANNIGGLLYGGETVNQSGVQSGHYLLDETNNSWNILNQPLDGGDYAVTNLINYGNGTVHMLRASGSKFYLDDTKPNIIPTNSGIIELHVYAQTWTGANCTNFYMSAVSPGNPITITNGAAPMTFYWDGTGWTNKITAALGYSPIQFTANSTNGYTPMVVQFNCPFTDNAGNRVIGWNWNFGDNTTSTGQNPVHTYIATNNTIFSPTLIVTNINGVTESATGTKIAVGTPSLSVAPAANGNLTVAWPGSAAGYTLQYTTNLTPPVVWTTISSAPITVNGQYVITSSVSNPRVFFRLMQSFALGSNVTVNQPVLSFTVANGNIILSWPDSFMGFKLESTMGVTPVAWATVQSAPVDVNGRFVVTNAISLSQAEVFFRLVSK